MSKLEQRVADARAALDEALQQREVSHTSATTCAIASEQLRFGMAPRALGLSEIG